MPDTDDLNPARPEPLFVSTHWSVVLAARRDTPRAREALGQLCRAYWYPLYAYVRRRGLAPADAQDLTQDFFARLIKGHWLAQADQERGRFRSFLLLAMKRFLVNEWHKARTRKRGGGVPLLSLEEAAAEHRYQREPADKSTPESLYERKWALTLLDEVLTRLEEEYRREGKSEWFEIMRPALTLDRGAIDYTGLARKLGVAGSAARVAVHRLRQRYREVLRDEVANTVVSPGEVEEEMRHLFRVLSEG